MGLVGGGQGAFIGRVHATAAILDNRAVLVAGALSSDPAKAKASAPDYDIKPERAYGSVAEMVAGESKLSPNERIDFVSVATPNHTHFEIAKAFAEAGFNVMCDKPLTLTLEQAEELAKVVQRTGVVFGVTHNYTGYPLVRQARDMVKSGELGEINAVRAFYLQGWLRRRLESEGQKQASWRTDPRRSGAAGCFGDIGTHAYNLGRFVTGLEWHQEEPNKMWLKVNGQPHRLYTRDPNAGYMTDTAKTSCRIPSGHPEAFLEAFANIYTAAYADMIARADGKKVDAAKSLYPNVADGVDGMNFITQCVASSKQDGRWLSLKHLLCRS
jgi:predicted dehydrogenase